MPLVFLSIINNIIYKNPTTILVVEPIKDRTNITKQKTCVVWKAVQANHKPYLKFVDLHMSSLFIILKSVDNEEYFWNSDFD